jgi:flagellar L-ring protein precursor FlgH
MDFRILLPLVLAACSPLNQVGRVPELSALDQSADRMAMMAPAPEIAQARLSPSSLWNGGPQSLLGDRRAMARGDILTVVIEINDKAEISNTTARSRKGSESLSIPSLFGIPQRIDQASIAGATLDSAVSTESSSAASGNGSVRRKEKLTLRIAATVTDVLPNGVLQIQGSQEVRVNYEIRELLVSGFVRPEDISRQNEITYDKIASARISYGGRGQISDVQQPRYGQQIVDIILPF